MRARIWRTQVCLSVVALSLPLAATAQSEAVADAVSALQGGDLAGAEQRLRTELLAHPDNVEALDVLGVVLDNEKKLPEADAVYRRATALAPRLPGLLNNYGNHLIASGKLTEARAVFGRVLALNPSQANAVVQLAHIAIQGKQPAEAARLLRRLPAGAAEQPDVLLLRLQILYSLQRNAEADALLARLPATVTPFALGTSLAAVGQYAKAEEALSRAVDAAPSNFEAVYALGLAAAHAGRHDRALPPLQAALRLQPENVDVLYDTAVEEIAGNQEEAALAHLAEAARLAPTRADVQKLLAHSTADLGYFGDAVAAWDRYLQIAPSDESARRERAFARTMVPGDPALPLAELQAYVRTHPNDAFGHFEWGTALAGSDPAAAHAELDQALRLAPNLTAAHLARGLLDYRGGKFPEALADFQFAAGRDPSNPAVLDRVGQALTALDRAPEAVEALRKASALAPADTRILLHLGRALAKAGKLDESSAVMARVRELGPDRSADPHPPGLVDFLNLSPAEQFSRYKSGLLRTLEKEPSNAEAQVRYLELLLGNKQTDEARSVAQKLTALPLSPTLRADAGRALVQAGEYAPAAALLKAAETPGVDRAIAAFHVAGRDAGLRELNQIPPSQRNGDWKLAHLLMVDPAAAARETPGAISAGGVRPDLYRDAALSLLRSGNKTDAALLLDTAARKLPDSSELLLLRAAVEESETQLQEIENRWPDWYQVLVAHALLSAAHQHVPEAIAMLKNANALAPSDPVVASLLNQLGRGVVPHTGDALLTLFPEAAVAR